MFLDQKINEKKYFFEVAKKKSNCDWVNFPVLPEKSENPTSGSASRAFFLLFLEDTFTHTFYRIHLHTQWHRIWGAAITKNAQEGIGDTRIQVTSSLECNQITKITSVYGYRRRIGKGTHSSLRCTYKAACMMGTTRFGKNRQRGWRLSFTLNISRIFESMWSLVARGRRRSCVGKQSVGPKRASKGRTRSRPIWVPMRAWQRGRIELRGTSCSGTLTY